MRLEVKIDTDAIKDSFAAAGKRYNDAFATAANMAVSMIRAQSEEDIQNAGNFGSRYLEGLSVTLDDDTITTRLDAPGASIFEEGGTIHGSPLLWIPLTGTDAEGTQASDYAGGLFSVNRKTGGAPLLFSISDRAPKYFGTPSVTIDKKFHLKEIQLDVMKNFRDYFSTALDNG